MRDNIIIYDIEIANEVDSVPGKWDNPEGMGFGSAVAYSYLYDRYYFFLHEDGKRRLVDLLNKSKVAVTFNGIKFDSKILLGRDRKCAKDGMTYKGKVSWKNYDILLEYIKSRFKLLTISQAKEKLKDDSIFDGSFSLNSISLATLGKMKTGHGKDAPIKYKNEEYDELLCYNFHDVRLTKALFDFIIEYGYVIDGNNRVVWIRY